MAVEATRADSPLCQPKSAPESSYERANGAFRPIKVRDTYSPSCDAAVDLSARGKPLPWCACGSRPAQCLLWLAVAGTVVSHSCPGIGVRGGFLHAAERDPCVEGGGDERVPQRVPAP